MDISDLKILDLCAGTGNISFEFISRDAAHVTAVDINSNCLSFIRKNAIEFNITPQLETIKSDILQYLKKTDQKFDLIFADPPCESGRICAASNSSVNGSRQIAQRS